jgi:rare lipoprotein A (peptidoglycan hydrolase)
MAESLMVDLSLGAARMLGVSGLAKVRLEVIEPSDPQVTEQLVAQLKLNDPAQLQGFAPPAGILAVAVPE